MSLLPTYYSSSSPRDGATRRPPSPSPTSALSNKSISRRCTNTLSFLASSLVLFTMFHTLISRRNATETIGTANFSYHYIWKSSSSSSSPLLPTTPSSKSVALLLAENVVGSPAIGDTTPIDQIHVNEEELSSADGDDYSARDGTPSSQNDGAQEGESDSEEYYEDDLVDAQTS